LNIRIASSIQNNHFLDVAEFGETAHKVREETLRAVPSQRIDNENNLHCLQFLPKAK
jgi:hypothetical protein